MGNSMKKYNVMTVFNHAYAVKHGKDWIESFYDKVDLKNVDNIFIIDTGLKDEDIDMFSKYEKVELIDAEFKNPETTKSWKKRDSDGNSLWVQHVLQKTKNLQKLAKDGNYPIIMIDGDCKFLKDFSHIITNHDVQVCKNEKVEKCGVNGRDKRGYMDLGYIGCYFSVNTEKGISFLDEWISEINKKVNDKSYKWYETPSLCHLMSTPDIRSKYSIGEVRQNYVAGEEGVHLNKYTLIQHLKTTAHKGGIFNDR